MANFNGPIGGIVPHEGSHAHGLAGIPAHEGIEPGVAGGLAGLYPFGEFFRRSKRSVAQIGPDMAFRVLTVKTGVEIGGVLGGGDVVKPDPAPVQGAHVRDIAHGQRVHNRTYGPLNFLYHLGPSCN